MAYEFHYTPTGTGVISGKEVLEQTEDAINDLGNTAISGVQEALDKAEQALTNSENAVDDAQTALNTANNAEGVAIQAQNDVSSLSGTVTNIGNRVTTAEGNISNLQGRMTTAEGNITNLQGRMTTAEGNIGNLQTAVSTAQATANSAQQTATTARQQSYVFRYSSTALVASSTNSNTLLDNTDNLKVGDKVIDSNGVLFSITAIDSQNSTFTIGTALIDLAQDSDVVHKSGNETISGNKTFSGNVSIYNSDTSVDARYLILRNSKVKRGSKTETGTQFITFHDKDGGTLVSYETNVSGSGNTQACINVSNLDANSQRVAGGVKVIKTPTETWFIPDGNNSVSSGLSNYKWKDVQTYKVNSLEPSSLSLPNYSGRIDISSYVTNLNGVYNAYTPSVDGWIAIQSSDATFIRIADTGSGGLGNTVTSQTAGILTCMIPVRANRQNNIYITCTTLTSAYFIPCHGNV